MSIKYIRLMIWGFYAIILRLICIMLKKIKISALFAVLVMFLVSGVFSGGVSAFSAYGLNTVAGHTTVLRTSQVEPGADVVFTVRKPDGSTFNLSSVANSNGVAFAEVSEYHTRTAGRYSVSLRQVDISSGGARSFYVYPNETSAHKSVLSPSDQVVNSSSGSARLKVRLADEYNNPVDGHVVRLIPSSPDSAVKSLSSSGRTNERGEMEFEVSSSRTGSVTYSAYDATSDVTLESKARVAYLGPGNSTPSSPDLGSSLFTSVISNAGSPSGAVDKLEFVNVPDSVNVGEDFSLTLRAYDTQDQIVPGYTGTVRFAVTSDNSAYAVVPGDYTFRTADQGEHTFSLAFSFLREGVYDLEVRDVNNPSIRGTVSLNATGEAPAPADGIAISSPVSNTTYGTNVQVVTGTAPAGADLRVFLNDRRVGEASADSDGRFSFTTSRLSDGDYKLYVASVNEVGTIIDTSSTVDFSIKTAAAEISRVSVDPPGEIGAGQIIKIIMEPTEPLSRASVLLDDMTHSMTRAPDGTYEVSVPAPIEFGEYPLTFTLVDQLGNEAVFEDEETLRVGPVAPPPVEAPGPVRNLRTTPEDGRVTLNWDPPVVGAEDIVHYRVFYGTSRDRLTDAVDTFTDATTWYVPNLENEVTYYFAVAAVNSRGAMSEHFEAVLPETPMPPVIDVPPIPDPSELEEALNDLDEDVSEVGPEIMWLVFLSFIGGYFYTRARKNRSGNCY